VTGDHPYQQLFRCCLLALLGFLSVLHGLAGLTFGYLPFFVLFGYIPLQGVPAVAASLGSIALGVAFATYPPERYAARATWAATLRRRSYLAWAVAWLVAVLATAAMVAFDWYWLGRPAPVAPRAEWPMWPLPWVWPQAVGFARDGVVNRLIVFGVSTLFAMLLFMKLQWPRPAFICMGLIAAAFGGYFIGDGAWLYASARGLGGLLDGEHVEALRNTPGLHNAWTVVAWWTGVAAILFGGLFGALAVLLPREVVDRIEFRD
jgi:hypothetical protein